MPEQSEYRKALLERSSAIKERFNDARDSRDNTAQQADRPHAAQIQNDAPGMHLRPSGPIRDAVDGQAHREAMVKDDQAAKNYNDALKDRMQRIKDSQNTENSVNSKDENYKD
jgi:hypothetical protein